MDTYRLLDANLDNLSTTSKSFPSLDANGMEDELFKTNKAYPYEKSQSIESFYKPLNIGRGDYFSSLKQSYPDFEKITRTQAKVVEYKITNIKELKMLYLKNDVKKLNGYFRKLYRYMWKSLWH